MGHLLHRRPSAAMIVAIAALVVATSGTAVAATQLVSGDSIIKKNSLSGNRLMKRSVQGSKIKLSSLGTVPTAAHATSADSATNATNATNAAAAPISKLTYVTTDVSVPINEPGAGLTATATCPSGTFVTGGGASITDTTNGFVNDTYPTGKTGWGAVFFEGPQGATTSATVTAICAPAAATAP